MRGRDGVDRWVYVWVDGWKEWGYKMEEWINTDNR